MWSGFSADFQIAGKTSLASWPSKLKIEGRSCFDKSLAKEWKQEVRS
jgi:hypothetical protein